jgi:CBS domain containing-hemolysin-like protein
MSLGELALIIGLVLTNGYFVAVEFSVLASRRPKVEPLAEEGSRRARAALDAMRELNVQLAGAQLGITTASLVLGFVGEPAMAGFVEDVLDPVGLPHTAAHAIAFVIGLTIVVFLHMLVGEMVPKNIAIAEPERTLLLLILPQRLWLAVVRPIVRTLTFLAAGMVRLLGAEPRDEIASAHTADELAAMVRAARTEGLIEEAEHQLLTGALVLGGRRVSSVMVPRDRIVWVPRTATPADAESLVAERGHSRLLVAGSDLDDVLGYVHVKDLLTLPASARERRLPLSRIRRMLVVSLAASLEDVLVAMQRARLHVAVVADESLQDVFQRGDAGGAAAAVGDIRDETDPAPNPLR